MSAHDELIAAHDYPGLEVPGSDSSPHCAQIPAYVAALEIASETNWDSILHLVVEKARLLVDARIAAIHPAGAATEVITSHSQGTESLASVIADVVENSDLPSSDVSRFDSLSDVSATVSDDQAISDWPVITVPVVNHGRYMAMIWCFGSDKVHRFSDQDISNLELIATHAASAMIRGEVFDRAEDHKQSAREQLLQIRQVLDNLPAGVLVMQPPDAAVQMSNNTALEMIFRSSPVRSSIPLVFRDFRWLGPDGQELLRSGHPGIAAFRGERLENRQLMLQNAVGEKIPVLVQSAPLVTRENDVTGAVVVFQDFSSIRAAEQIKDDFLSLISHEFRTPLTAIHGGAILLQQQWRDLDNETRSELLADIGTESSRLDRMLGNLLSVAEIMAGRFQRETEPIVIAPLVQELIEEFDEHTPTHELTWYTDDHLPLAEGDPDWLSQIMRNLYENAIKYSPAGGEIRTEAHQSGNVVRISVADQGLGILPDHVADVFERFRRPGADPTVRGMGLGLYLSRLLVDAMGGRIHAASDGPGTGSTFTVELPIVREWEASPERGDPHA